MIVFALATQTMFVRVLYKPIIRIVVTALLLYGLLQLVSAMDVLAVLTSFAPAQLLLPFSVSLLVELVVAMRLVLLLKTQRVEIPFSHVLRINLSTRFFSLWLPGGNVTGFGVRVLQTASFSGDMAGSIAAIAVDRLVKWRPRSGYALTGRESGNVERSDRNRGHGANADGQLPG